MGKDGGYYSEYWRCIQFLIPTRGRVLYLGFGIGDVLAALKSSVSAGVDVSRGTVDFVLRDG